MSRMAEIMAAIRLGVMVCSAFREVGLVHAGHDQALRVRAAALARPRMTPEIVPNRKSAARNSPRYMRDLGFSEMLKYTSREIGVKVVEDPGAELALTVM